MLEENANLQTEVGVKLERREFDLWPLVEALTHDLHPVAGTASTRLVNQVPDDLVVYADASLLRRIFQNLIANAIKYTPRGEVVIGARELEAEGAVECWVSRQRRRNPRGVCSRSLRQGRDPIRENEGGTGLGLAIVKTFTEAHGGTVTVQSQQGVGSTFRIRLPTKASAGGRTESLQLKSEPLAQRFLTVYGGARNPFTVHRHQLRAGH